MEERFEAYPCDDAAVNLQDPERALLWVVADEPTAPALGRDRVDVAGEIVDVNSDLDDNPSLVNEDPYGAGWMIKLRVEKPAELSQLLTSAHYAEHIGE